MEKIEDFIKKNIINIVPEYDQLDFDIYIDKKGYSIEFTVLKDNNSMQCYEMVDQGIIEENDLNDFFDKLATFIKDSDFFNKDILNKYKFSIKN